MPPLRLQKILSAAGLGSRRACEEIIRDGRVTVNGVAAQVGASADASVDDIRVDGRRLPAAPTTQTFALYKPRMVVSSLAAQGERSTVRDLLPFSGRFFPVGRLDMESEGLMLMTNDGELAQRVTHPRYQVEKEYRVLLAARPSPSQVEIWERGVVLEDGFRTGKARVKMERPFGKGAWVKVVMHEGHKHEIREIGRRIGLPVVRIQRIRIGSVVLGTLKPGDWRALTPDEIASLQAGQNLPPDAGKGRVGVKMIQSARKPDLRKRPRKSGGGKREDSKGRKPPTSASRPGAPRNPAARNSSRKPKGRTAKLPSRHGR